MIFKLTAFQTSEEKRKAIGLYIIHLSVLIVGIIGLGESFLGNPKFSSIPGEVSLIAMAAIGLYSLYHERIIFATNSLFIGLSSIYFYFVSHSYAILPVHQTIQFSLISIVLFLLFMLFLSHSRLKLTIFYTIAMGLLAAHVWEANRLDLIYSIFWSPADYILNPLLITTATYLVCLLTAWSFELNLRELREKNVENETRTNEALRQMQFGYLELQINKDETGNVLNMEVLKVNQNFESMFKISAREVRNIDPEIIFPKIFRDSFDWHNYFHFSKKAKTEFYVEHLQKWIEISTVSPAKDIVICFFSDITNKQFTISSLKESRKRYKVLLEAIPDLFFIIDKDGIYVDFVIKDSELLQIDPDDIIGNSIFEVGFSERMARKIYQYIQDAIKFDSIETIEYALGVEKGTAMFEMRLAKLDDNSVIGIARDITKRKMAELRLEEAKVKAEEADQLKSAFLANISHEIRTPMNAIIGFSRMIGSPDFDTEEKERFIEIITSNGRLLMEMINDMISISKIESNQVVLHKSFVKINDMLIDLFREYTIDVSNKPIRLRLNNENANPRFGVSTDRYLLTEVLKKLLENAIKFTHEGEIEFGYAMDGKKRLKFFVRDTGIGIESHNLERIFDRFHQIDNKKTRKYEGTGLGLAIAQHYVVTLGGRIEVSSVVDKGSEFWFSIPFEDGDGTLKIVR